MASSISGPSGANPYQIHPQTVQQSQVVKPFALHSDIQQLFNVKTYITTAAFTATSDKQYKKALESARDNNWVKFQQEFIGFLNNHPEIDQSLNENIFNSVCLFLDLKIPEICLPTLLKMNPDFEKLYYFNIAKVFNERNFPYLAILFIQKARATDPQNFEFEQYEKNILSNNQSSFQALKRYLTPNVRQQLDQRISGCSRSTLAPK
jgi:hypothetical protein